MSDHQSRSYIPVAKPVIGELETDYVLKAIRKGEVSSRGRFVTEFESRFAKRVGAEKARQLRDRGSDPNRRYWHPVIGFNYRMPNLQAALGVAQLEQMDLFLQRRKEIALSYQRRFTGVSEIKLQLEETWAKPVAWMSRFSSTHRCGIA